MPRKKNLLLLNIFSINEKNEAICNYDNCKNKVLSPHCGNLERHLKLLHAAVYKRYIVKKQAKANYKNAVELTERRVANSDVNRKEIEFAIVETFTKNGHPLQLVEERAFKILVQPAFEVLELPVSLRSVNERILAFAQQLKLDISKDLKGKLISLKIDVAARKDLCLLGINVQYVKNRQIETKTLAVKELRTSHSAEYLIAIILEVFEEYSVDINQILSVTIDSAGDMLQAANDLNKDFQMEDIDEKFDFERETTEGKMKSVRSHFTSHGISGVRCGAQNLQLCVFDVFDIPKVKTTLAKLRDIAQKLRDQKYSTYLKDNCYEEPSADCPSRWNSTFMMIDGLLEIKDIIQSLSLEDSSLRLTSADWEFAEQFVEAFKTVNDASLKLQGQQVCFSELYVIVMDIKFRLDALPTNLMTTALKKSLDLRILKLFDMELFNAAVYLDPRIKVCMTAEQKERAKNYITTLYKRMESLKENASEASDTSVNNETLSIPSTSSNAALTSFSEYLENLDTLKTEPVPSLLLHIEADLMMYDRQPRLPLESSVIDFWSSQYNALSCIANTIAAIPCTQGSVDRLFSSMDYLVVNQCGTVAEVEHVLFVKINGVFEHDK